MRRGDPALIPASGFTARLVVGAAGLMSFLAVVFLGLGLAAGAVSERWQRDLIGTATVRLPQETPATELSRIVGLLEQTEGVAQARLITRGEAAALLEPWLGAQDLPDGVALHRLIAVTGTPDMDGLRFRLQGEAPAAVLDDHDRWRRPVVAGAARLQALALVSAGLVALAAAAVLALAAQAALAANAGVIGVLRLVGARDRYIAGLFIRRFAMRSLTGAAAGSFAGAVMLALLTPPGAPLPILGVSLAFSGADWLLPALVPLVAASLAAVTTAAAARHVLKEIP